MMKNSTRFIVSMAACWLSVNAYAEMSFAKIKEAYTNSYRYEKTQNYNDAINALMPVFTQYPTTYTVNLRLGYLSLQQSKYANAKTYYEAAAKALPLAFSPKLGLMAKPTISGPKIDVVST